MAFASSFAFALLDMKGLVFYSTSFLRRVELWLFKLLRSVPNQMGV